MRLVIASEGRWRRGPERALYEHYAARIAPLARTLGWGPLELLESPRAKTKAQGTAALLELLPAGSYWVALDAGGKDLSSPDFAALLAGRRAEARPATGFLIGGPDGLGPVKNKADTVMRFGAQIWPHLLVRGLVAEQIYRAATILLNHPYHVGH